MTYIFAPTLQRGRNFALDAGLRPSKVTVITNGSRSLDGRMFWSEDVIHVLPGISTAIRHLLKLQLMKSRYQPLVVDHEHS